MQIGSFPADDANTMQIEQSQAKKILLIFRQSRKKKRKMESKQVCLFFKQEADEKRDAKLPRRWQLEGVYGQQHCHSHLTGFFSFPFHGMDSPHPHPVKSPFFERPIGCLTYREEGIPVKIMKAMSDCHDMKFPHGWCLACLHENIQIHQRAHCQLLNCSKRLLVNFCLKSIKLIFTLL